MPKPNVDFLPQQMQDIIILFSLKTGNPYLFILFFLSEDIGGVICELITVRSYRTTTSTSSLTKI